MVLTSQYIQNPRSKQKIHNSNIICDFDLNLQRDSNLQRRVRISKDRRTIMLPGTKVTFQANDSNIDMIYCPKGSHTLKWYVERIEYSENIVLPNPFLMGETEVTQKQFKAVMGYNPSEFKSDETRPVEQVSWFDAILFCNRLSLLNNLMPFYCLSDVTKKGNHITYARIQTNIAAEGFRLPSVAEWEYAAKAGTNNQWAGCDDFEALYQYAWYGNRRGATQGVKKKMPNEWGFYDMTGNVREWCSDAYFEKNKLRGKNPYKPYKNSEKPITKGGHYGADFVEIEEYSTKHACEIHNSSGSTGFRLAKNITSK